ncbi:MAG TPA: hypothetical protein ENN69_05615, partial [Spirochaetia bacterium]|nr:hypothetical protein [Spirochaetia bacterium]
MRLSTAKITFFLLLMCATPTVLCAGGQGEDRIREANELIDAKEDERALVLLTEIYRTDPERKAEAQHLINVIMLRKQRVNELKEDIIRKIEAGYDEEVLASMEELKRLDPDVTGWIEETRKLWEVIKRNREFNDLMDRAYALLEAGRYREAIDVYRKGFDFQRDEFFNNTAYGNILKGNVQSLFRRFDALIAEYLTAVLDLQENLDALRVLIEERRYREVLSKARDIESGLDALLAVRGRLVGVGNSFTVQNNNVRRSGPEQKGDNFLYYSSQVVLGRKEKLTREGVFFVVEAHWSRLTDGLAAELEAVGERFFKQGRDQYAAGGFEAADASFGNAREYHALAAQSLARYYRTVSRNAPGVTDLREKMLLREKLPRYLFNIERGLESRAYRELVRLKTAAAGMSETESADPAIFARVRNEIQASVALIQARSRFWDERAVVLANLKRSGGAPEEIDQAVPEIRREFSLLLASYRNLDVEIAVAAAEKEYRALAVWYEEAQARFAEAKDLRTGGTDGNENRESKKYP